MQWHVNYGQPVWPATRPMASVTIFTPFVESRKMSAWLDDFNQILRELSFDTHHEAIFPKYATLQSIIVRKEDVCTELFLYASNGKNPLPDCHDPPLIDKEIVCNICKHSGSQSL